MPPPRWAETEDMQAIEPCLRVRTASQSTRLTTPYSLLAGLSWRGEGILRSTAAAEAALADSVASVLALHEEFFVCHDRLVRVRLPPMLHLGLIVGDAHPLTG